VNTNNEGEEHQKTTPNAKQQSNNKQLKVPKLLFFFLVFFSVRPSFIIQDWFQFLECSMNE